ncbi:MAG: LysM peptidoglycan-binding domain-containing protein [Gammaproteobacteria bacterium]|nr:LysM peptidoglycan-binding domain-containing protein [Gammaproteobacteria bacterium]
MRHPVQTLFFALILLGYVVSGQAESRQSIDNLRLWHSPDSTRVVFDVSSDVRYSMFSLDQPQRLVVDIENADLSFKLPSLQADNPHISAVRSGQPRAGVLRFVFELKKPLKSNSFLLSPNELYGHRLVVDLDDPQALPVTAAIQVAPSVSDSDRPRPFIVAIDAGHGGEDPGATGYRGSREKQITLSIAKRLQQVIDADPGMRSLLVRRGDYYVKLHDRRLIARRAGADIFVSIHADAFKRRSARGFSVFALSQRGATSAMARALAAKENASDLIGGVSLANKDEVLAKVLVDLSMTNTISDSVNLGGRVLQQLGKLGKLHSKRVEQAGFAVLKSADIPSILIETGFITNPTEEKNLRSSTYQGKVARAIYAAIKEYHSQTPYSNNATFAAPAIDQNRVASTSRSSSSAAKPKRHKVQRGDTLSTIAQRYGTSSRELKRLNKLRGDVVVLGKWLTLPGGSPSAAARTAQRQPSKRSTNSSQRPAVHVVGRGDSLSKISARYNITITSLKRANNLRRDTVYLGQKIKLPGGTVAAASKPRYHKVRRGDTLSEIAEQYGATMQTIMRANQLRTQTVMLGQTLKIPHE